MKHIIALAALAACLPFSQAARATEVGVSVQISQPGVHGRIDIGHYPQPVLVQAQPVIIVREVVRQPVQPVYMWVPPGHRKDWRKHCGQYQACGVPVYFVQDTWYDQHVKPHGKGKDKNKHGKKDD